MNFQILLPLAPLSGELSLDLRACVERLRDKSLPPEPSVDDGPYLKIKPFVE